MPICNFCNGARRIKVLACPGARLEWIDCPTCKGTGELTDDQVAKIKAGLEIRKARLENYKTQAEAAAERGMSVQDYAKLESGRL